MPLVGVQAGIGRHCSNIEAQKECRSDDIEQLIIEENEGNE